MADEFEIENLLYEADADCDAEFDHRQRTTSVELTEDDLTLDRSLRPRLLSDYLGQEKVYFPH